MPTFTPDPRHGCMAPCAASLRAGLCPTTPCSPAWDALCEGPGSVSVPRLCLMPAPWKEPALGASGYLHHHRRWVSARFLLAERATGLLGRATALMGGVFRQQRGAPAATSPFGSSGQCPGLEHPACSTVLSVPVPSLYESRNLAGGASLPLSAVCSARPSARRRLTSAPRALPGARSLRAPPQPGRVRPTRARPEPVGAGGRVPV